MLGNAEQYFIAVARAGSFTQAARNLYVSQPAISRQISILEKKLGYTLFDRSTRRVRLTSRGKIIYEVLVNCSDEWENAVEKARDMVTAGNSILRVGVMNGWNSFSQSLSTIFDFQKRYTDIDVSIHQYNYKELTKKLLEQKLDLILTLHAEIPGDSGIHCAYAFTEDMVLYSAASHPLSRQSSLPHAFDGVNFYVMNQEASVSCLPHAQEYLKQRGWNFKLIGLPSVDSIYTAIRNGKGFGMTLSISRVCKSSRYKTFNIGAKKDLYYAWNQHNYCANLQRFLDFVRERAVQPV